MNIHASPKKNPSRAPETGDVTVGPRMGGRKIYEPGVLFPHIRVPHRQIDLHPTAEEPPVVVYDPSGPYTEDAPAIDIARGLGRQREAWLARRGRTPAGWRGGPRGRARRDGRCRRRRGPDGRRTRRRCLRASPDGGRRPAPHRPAGPARPRGDGKGRARCRWPGRPRCKGRRGRRRRPGARRPWGAGRSGGAARGCAGRGRPARKSSCRPCGDPPSHRPSRERARGFSWGKRGCSWRGLFLRKRVRRRSEKAERSCGFGPPVPVPSPA